MHDNNLFEKTYYLWKLANICAIQNKKILDFEEELKTLDAYYIESRYPPEVKIYSRTECKKILNIAQKLTQFILDKIL